MAWALVKWIEEDRISVIPSSWIVEPSSLPEQHDFPVAGSCYWKKKSCAEILQLSGELKDFCGSIVTDLNCKNTSYKNKVLCSG